MNTSLDKSTNMGGKTYTVYIHKNKINGKVYIGQTRTPVHKRWQDGKGYKGCILFERAINKYGWDNFEHIIFADNLTKEESSQMEKDLIAQYDSTNPQKGYNISVGGDSGHTGVPMNEDARKKISEAQKGKVISQETRNKMSLAQAGRVPIEAIQKAAELHSIPIVQLTKNGAYVARYPSAAEAERQTDIDANTINACRNGKNKSAGDFLWIAESEYNGNLKNNNFYYHNDHLRPIVQLSKSGQYIGEFPSCKAAQIAMNKRNSNSINSCCRGDTKSAYGFIWVYKDEYDENQDYSYKREPYGNQYAVIQMDLNRNFIAEFDTVKKANQATGVNYCCICECCNGTQKTAGGFIWERK